MGKVIGFVFRGGPLCVKVRLGTWKPWEYDYLGSLMFSITKLGDYYSRLPLNPYRFFALWGYGL